MVQIKLKNLVVAHGSRCKFDLLVNLASGLLSGDVPRNEEFV
jgi:hypothetical protein